jgi:uncharacterized protein (DUF1330 family)
MSCYFIVSVFIGNKEKRPIYDEYIRNVRPIVEKQGGKYLVRTENIIPFTGDWKPDRIIVIRFNNREELDKCFASEEYRQIKDLRINSVVTKALIAEDE